MRRYFHDVICRRSVFAVALFVAIIAIGIHSLAGNAFAVQWTEYYVPDRETAEAIATAVSRPLLMKADFAKAMPFSAALDGDEWVATSTPAAFKGLAPCASIFIVVKISRVTGQILDWSVDNVEGGPPPPTRECQAWLREHRR